MSMLEEIRKKFADPVFIEEMAEQLRKKSKVQEAHYNRVKKFIDSKPKEEFDNLLLSFLKWEEKFEEFQYTHRHCQTESIIFYNIKQILGNEAEQLSNLREDFLCEAFKYGNWIFKTYCGQGCFTRVLYKDEVIFQST